MRLEIEAKTLRNYLVTAKRATSKQKALPALGKIAIASKAGRVVMRSTDLERFLEIDLGPDTRPVPGTTGALVDPKTLGAVLKGLAGTLELGSPDLGILDISQGGTLLTVLNGSDPTELPGPDVMAFDGADVHGLDASEVTDLLGPVVHAMSDDAMRHNLCGVCLERDGDNLIAVATDGHRLAHHRARIDWPIRSKADGGTILPRDLVLDLVRLAKRPKAGRIVAQQQSGLVAFQIGPVRLVGRLIEGEFPNWRQVVPKSIDTMVRLQGADLAQALEAVRPCASDRTGAVKVTVSADRLELHTESEEHGKADRFVPAQAPLESSVTFGVNGRYLAEALEALDLDQAMVGLTGDTCGPILLREMGEAGSQALVMPMRL